MVQGDLNPKTEALNPEHLPAGGAQGSGVWEKRACCPRPGSLIPTPHTLILQVLEVLLLPNMTDH